MKRSVYFGFDSREGTAYAVAYRSLTRQMTDFDIKVHPIILRHMQTNNLYRRRVIETIDGKLYDEISEHPMSTEHAISRFLTPTLHKGGGWAVFMDSDVLVRTDIAKLFNYFESGVCGDYALMCVQHNYAPSDMIKKQGDAQSVYYRKNWSSVMAFNCSHAANNKLTLSLINSVPGRDLHAFCWLDDKHIGHLDPGWNYLVGEQAMPEPVYIAHFTTGVPGAGGNAHEPLGQEWTREAHAWAMNPG